nr:hypothetical protein Iba_chr09bCG4230 [Ipomoea batatas]
MLRSFIATASLGISSVSSWVRVRTNLAGFPAQSSPLGILLPGGTTDPASRIECVSTKEPSISMECWPMMHSGSIVQDLKRLYAPMVTYLSIAVSAGSPGNFEKNNAQNTKNEHSNLSNPISDRGRPSGVNDTSLLDIGAEADGDLVEIPAENGAIPDRGAVPDGYLTGEYDVGGHVGVHSYLRGPLPERDDLSLPSIVPLDSIRR